METTTTTAPPPRRLRRRPDDGPIAGVCAGVAEYFNVDPTIVRIATVVLAFSGPGLIAYIAAWIVMPAASGPATQHAVGGPAGRSERTAQTLGVALLVLAGLFIWGDWWGPGRRWLFPVLLMGLGAWLLLRRDPETDGEPPAAAVDRAPDAGAVVSAEVAASAADDIGAEPPEPPTQDHEPPAPDAPPPRGRRRVLGPVVFGALLMWTGLAWLTGVGLETGLAIGLLILGLGFVLGAFVGGSKILVLPALVVAFALVAVTVVDIPLSGPVGEQRWTPQRLSEVADHYEMSMGEGTLDLSDIDLAARERLEVEVTIGLGHVVVLVPRGPTVETTSEVGAGEATVLGSAQDGLGFTNEQRHPGDSRAGTIVLDLRVGLGQIEVRRAG